MVSAIPIGIERDHLYLVGRPRRALLPGSQARFVIDGAENNWVEFMPDNC